MYYKLIEILLNYDVVYIYDLIDKHGQDGNKSCQHYTTDKKWK